MRRSSPAVEAMPLYRRERAVTRPRWRASERAAAERALKPRSSSERETHSCGAEGGGGGEETSGDAREGWLRAQGWGKGVGDGGAGLEAVGGGDGVAGEVQLGEGRGEAEGGVRGHQPVSVGRTR